MRHESAERIFRNREEAGRELGERLKAKYTHRHPLVLGLPRGGVPVAYEVACALDAPLDVFVVRKLGAPFNPELAVGAIASGGVIVHNRYALDALSVSEEDLDEIVAREQRELARRERLYRSGLPPIALKDKTAILVDDGIATGATMGAAVASARALGPRMIVVAAPTAAREAVGDLENVADAVEVLIAPEPYIAVGAWYAEFPQLRDQEVVNLLQKVSRAPART